MTAAPTLLVTGGAGFIGTHTIVELMAAGFDVVVLDNFSHGSLEALRRVEVLTQRKLAWVAGDVRDAQVLNHIFDEQIAMGSPIVAVVHFAALKAVGESVAEPLRYYDNNVNGTLVLLAAMQRVGLNRIVFSSSATVYGAPQVLPLVETHPLSAMNPYGQTKLMVENVLQDLCRAQPEVSAVTLRYFNPIGAHPSGLIGEDPEALPSNLFPFITRVGLGLLPYVPVFGTDYPTCDGTGVRDYIHVVDLARGHVAAVRYALANQGFVAVNLGTGRATSVLELIDTFSQVSGREVPWQAAPRRVGDIAEAWADPSLAKSLLGWQAQFDLRQMCEDGWRWQTAHPQGYRREC